MEGTKCPDCGTIIEEGSNLCLNCGCKIGEKRKLKPVLVLSIVMALFIIWVLLASGGSVKIAFNIVSRGNFSCMVKHTCTEATCVSPKKCLLCGAERGKLGEHEWVEATCEYAKTCKHCRETVGKKLGHLTRLGTCSRCGIYVTELKEEYNALLKMLEEVASLTYDVANDLQYATIFRSKSIDYIIDAIEGNRKIENILEKALNECAKYQEFKGFSALLREAKSSLKTYPNGGNINDSNIDSYFDELVESVKTLSNVMKKTLEYEFK